MRLIDVDEVIKYFPTEEPLCRWALKNATTVEAIPIEWLIDIMRQGLVFAHNDEREGVIIEHDGIFECFSGALAAQVIQNILALWEKENGKE